MEAPRLERLVANWHCRPREQSRAKAGKRPGKSHRTQAWQARRATLGCTRRVFERRSRARQARQPTAGPGLRGGPGRVSEAQGRHGTTQPAKVGQAAQPGRGSPGATRPVRAWQAWSGYARRESASRGFALARQASPVGWSRRGWAHRASRNGMAGEARRIPPGATWFGLATQARTHQPRSVAVRQVGSRQGMAGNAIRVTIMKKSNAIRTNISLPDSLKRQMEAYPRQVNWSAIAARAFSEFLCHQGAFTTPGTRIVPLDDLPTNSNSSG